MRRGRRLAALALVALVVAPSSVALAAGLPAPDGSSPFSPGVPLTPSATTTAATTTPTVVATSTSTSSGGLSGTSAILIAVGAIIVLGGIAYFIWADARRHAPRTVNASVVAAGRSGSKTPPKSRKLSAAERRRRKRGRAR